MLNAVTPVAAATGPPLDVLSVVVCDKRRWLRARIHHTWRRFSAVGASQATSCTHPWSATAEGAPSASMSLVWLSATKHSASVSSLQCGKLSARRLL